MMPNPYGHTWRTVTRPAILARSGGVFEDGHYLGGARCARCETPDQYPLGAWMRSLLDCAHLSGDSSDDSEENTAALCRKCHRANDYKSWAAKYKAWVIQQKIERAIRLDEARPLLAAIKEIEAFAKSTSTVAELENR